MEFKMVIQVKDNKATIGVSAPDTDPVFETAQGNLEEILAHANTVIFNAQEKWKTAKKNPAITGIPKPAAPAPAAPRPTVGKSPSKPSTPQVAMF